MKELMAFVMGGGLWEADTSIVFISEILLERTSLNK